MVATTSAKGILLVKLAENALPSCLNSAMERRWLSLSFALF